MVKVRWHAEYAKRDSSGKPITTDFDVIYFLQVLNDTPKIFAYITGDEQQAYQDLGIAPAESAQAR
jgi:hypothetical protein